MKATDDLHQLIQSLNKGEKRYFLKYAAIQGTLEGKNYLELFHAVELQKEYDEQKIKTSLKRSDGLVKQFAFYKKYLFELIMKSLRSYRAESSVIFQLENIFQNTMLLYEKGLYHLCLKSISKGKKIAIKNEKHVKYSEFIELEDKVLSLMVSARKNEDFIASIFRDRKEMLNLELNNAELRYLQNRLFYLTRHIGTPRNKENRALYDRIVSNPILSGEYRCLCFLSTFYYLNIWAVYYGAVEQWEDSLSYRFKLIKHIENSSVDWSIKGPYYSAALHNLLNALIYLKKYSLFDENIRKIENYPTLSLKSKSSYYVLLLAKNINVFEPKKNCSIGDEIIKFITKHKHNIARDEELVFYYKLFYSHFICQNYSKSLSFLNKIINDRSNLSIRTDLRNAAYFLALIVYYELEHYDLLEYALKNTKNHFAKKGSLYTIESLFIKLLNSLIRLKTFAEKKKKIIETLKLLKPIENENEVKTFLLSFDIFIWLESKKANKSFLEVMKEKVEIRSKHKIDH